MYVLNGHAVFAYILIIVQLHYLHEDHSPDDLQICGSLYVIRTPATYTMLRGRHAFSAQAIAMELLL